MSDLTKNVSGASGGALGVGKTSAGVDVNMSSKVVSDLRTDNSTQGIPTADLLNQTFEKTANDIVNTKMANFDSKSSSLAPLSKIQTPELEKIGKPFQGTIATMLPAKAFTIQQRG